MKKIKTFEEYSKDLLKDNNLDKPKKKKYSKLTYDEKEMRRKGLKSWRGPNPNNK